MDDEVIVYYFALCQELILSLQGFLSLAHSQIYVSIKTINAISL